MPESNWGSRWWRDWIGKKSDSSCKISNETVAGIEILFKEKDLKYLEFVFVYYRDDPIRKDHDWEFFDRLSLRKRQNRINLNSGPLFEILVKHWICYLMSAFREKRPIEVEGFFKQQGAGTIAKGPETTTWIWNLHADAHDFDSHTSDLEEISRKVFSAHFGQLSIIFLWLSGMYFHGARFSNYEAWLSDPTHIGPSAQVVWPIVGQEILNGDVGGGFRGIQITSGFFQIWRASGITSELQLYCTAIGALIFAALMLFAGWFHYHKAAPKLAWFQDVESMLNHHLAGLLGLGSLSWAGHQVHVSLPINQFLNAGVDPKEIPLPHEFILNRDLLAQLYPSFAEGATPFFTLNWSKYADFLTFRGGLDPVTGGLWLTDTAHHHLAIAILFLIAGHMYRTNWGIGHGLKDILEAHKGPFTGQGHKGLYEILTTSWHAQLSLNLAMLGSLTIVVAHHMYAMPPYPYLATDYGTQLSLFTHHMWIGGFLIVGAAAHAAIFMVRDYDPTTRYNDELTVSCSISLPDGGSFHPSLTVLLRYRSPRSI
ncbi:hypothetical protein E3N88_25329 [Mikania micrantha]|uniref:Photosystem I P700 chlorophyll a apoprotein A1 n=1 Tax=Mikania micrantha TaxID=192012 RepID=A0A5N6N796_9ASTR|nr:hypothetical protein E3N88_25329 [Mikania micrantha]